MIKRLVVFFFLIGLICWLFMTIPTEKSSDISGLNEDLIEKSREEVVIDKIIATSKTHLGVPYKQAGTTSKGFDCSGLIMTSFAKQGVYLPRASYEMVKKGEEIPSHKIKRGDLVFFKTNPQRPNKVSHVGLVTMVKDDKVYFIHSSTKRGVIINELSESYYKKRFHKAKRIL